jgi:hypothetical protein
VVPTIVPLLATGHVLVEQLLDVCPGGRTRERHDLAAAGLQLGCLPGLDRVLGVVLGAHAFGRIGSGGGGGALLDAVGDLVGEDAPAVRAAGVERASGEKEIPSDREGRGVESLGGHGGLGVGMDA